jgi:hypothetical protein
MRRLSQLTEELKRSLVVGMVSRGQLRVQMTRDISPSSIFRVSGEIALDSKVNQVLVRKSFKVFIREYEWLREKLISKIIYKNC